MPGWLTITAVVVLFVLGWMLFRRLGSDRIELINEKRRSTSRVVGRGEFVDANRRQDVALAVTHETFFYENADMDASIDLQWVREIEYDTELATGLAIENGRVLRLRSQSQTFEFVLPAADVSRWYLMLPPRRTTEAAAADRPVPELSMHAPATT